MISIAERLFTAIEAGDVDAVRDLYADDIVVWHNNDGTTQDKETNLRVLGWLTCHLRDLRYTEVVRREFPGGFVQQHVLRATTESGDALEVPACVVLAVSGDRVVRIDEYLDSAHLAPLAR